MREMEWRFALDDNPGCGLWRIRAMASASADASPIAEASALFEVLADEEDVIAVDARILVEK